MLLVGHIPHHMRFFSGPQLGSVVFPSDQLVSASDGNSDVKGNCNGDPVDGGLKYVSSEVVSDSDLKV